MDQLIERMLAVGSRLAPVDRPGLVLGRSPIHRHMLAVALHRQLLEVGGKALQVLLVGQHGDGLGAEEVGVPDGQQSHEHRQIALEGCGSEVLVHLVEPVEHAPELLRADRQHRREADRRIHRIAAADPVPELEHVGCIDAELGDLPGIGRNGDEVLGDRGGIASQLVHRPGAGRMGVGHRLQRGEGLRRDDEERVGGIQIGDGFGEVGAVHVRDEPEGQGTIAVVPQRLVGHDRPEIRPADADVDDVADSLAGVAGPGAASNPVAEIAHAIEHAMDVRDHIVPVDDDRRRCRRSQRHVQNRAILGDVDLVAAEHGVDPPTQIRFIRELAQQPHRLVGDAMLRVVEIDAGGFGRQPLAAAGIVLEQLTQVPGLAASWRARRASSMRRAR